MLAIKTVKEMPIKNLPTAEKLTQFSLILYFEAWSRLIEIFDDFEITYEGGRDDWPEEWQDYLGSSQKDFEAITNLAAQAVELGLKGKLCETSPFLLLLGAESSLKTTSFETDFSDLRTIDAVDLPGAINTFCATPLSDKFISKFNQIRKLRNKVVHLGDASSYFSPDDILDDLIFLYSELWIEKSWLGEWLRSNSSGRTAFFHDGRNGSAHAAVFEKLPTAINLLKNGQFKAIFGIEKSKRRYHCFDCTEAGRTKWSSWDGDDLAKTAHLNPEGTSLQCLMCDGAFSVVRKRCNQEDCPGNVLGTEAPDADQRCHTCCEYQQIESV